MKLKSLLLLMLASVPFFAGCGGNGIEPEPPADISIGSGVDLNPVIPEEGGIFKIDFSATAAWSVSAVDDTKADLLSWLSVTPVRGSAGTYQLSVSVDPNQDYSERAASISIVCGNVTKSIRLTQKQKDALLMSADIVNVPAEGQTVTLKVKSNIGAVPATISKDAQEWIVPITDSKALVEYTCNFEVKPNTGTEKRMGTIFFYSEQFKARSETVTIVQEGVEEDPDPDPEPEPDPPGPDPPGPDPVPSECDDLECPNPPTVGTVPLDKLYGFASGVTGGQGASTANVLHFNNGQALQAWLVNRAKTEKKNGDHSPVIIWMSGTFGPGDGRASSSPWFDVKEVSNLSFIGVDSFLMDRLGFFIVRSKNIIIRNVNFNQPKADNGADAISMQEADGVWVDHCTFTSLNQTKDYEDGSCDITHASTNVTVSWCRFIKTQKSCLVGHSSSATADVAIKATFHHNWFDASSSRHPRVRFGTAHVYNNLFENCSTYGVGSAMEAKVLSEYNYFDGVALPTDIATYPAKKSGSSWVSNLTDKTAGYLYSCANKYVNRPSNNNVAQSPYPFTNVQYTKYGGTAGTKLTYASFKPSYDYMVTAVEDLPSVVKSGAGYGKLGYVNAPVAVNNGGVDPGTGGGDDTGGETPGGDDQDDDDQSDPVPAAGLAEGWMWVNNNATTASYAADASGKLSVTASGKWESKAQGFGCVYRTVSGDFTATVVLEAYDPQKTSNQAVAGIFAATSDVSATATSLVFGLVGDTYCVYRLEADKDKGGASMNQPSATGGTTVLKMERSGNVLKLSVSKDGGATFGNVSSKEFVSLAQELKIGVAANSGDNSKTSTARFSNFTLNGTQISFITNN